LKRKIYIWCVIITISILVLIGVFYIYKENQGMRNVQEDAEDDGMEHMPFDELPEAIELE